MSITPTPPNNDEDFDIYADLPDVAVEKKQQYTEEELALKKQVSQLLPELETLRKQNKILQESKRSLSCNISVLYKTAATEIERKDEVIADLRRQIDNFLFRRRKKPASQKTQVTSEATSNLSLEAMKTNLKQRLENDTCSDLAISSPLLERMSLGDQQSLSESSKPSKENTQLVKKNESSPEGAKIADKNAKVQTVSKNDPKKNKIIEHVTVTNEKSNLDSEKSSNKSSKASTCDDNDKHSSERKSVWDRLGDGKCPFNRRFHEKQPIVSSSSGKAASDKKRNDQYSDQADKKETSSTKSRSVNERSDKVLISKKIKCSSEDKASEYFKSTKSNCVNNSFSKYLTDKKQHCKTMDEPKIESSSTKLIPVNSRSGEAATDMKAKYLSKDEACENSTSIESSSGNNILRERPKCQDQAIGDVNLLGQKSQDTSKVNCNLNLEKFKTNLIQKHVNDAHSAAMNSSPNLEKSSCGGSKQNGNKQVLSDDVPSISVDTKIVPETSMMKSAFVNISDCHTYANDSEGSAEPFVQEDNIIEIPDVRKDLVIKGATSHGISKDKTEAEKGVGCKMIVAESEPESMHSISIAVPKQFEQQPPLPKGDPAPKPPLPLTTPPPTPVKSPMNEYLLGGELQKTHVNPTQKVTEDLKVILFTSPPNTSQTLGIPSDTTRDNARVTKNVSALRWSDENLLMQCPFKPRRRAKSVVVLEDATEVSNQIITSGTGASKPYSNEYVTTKRSSLSKSPDGKYKKSPMKKGDDHKVSSDFRTLQNQRPLYSSRHLSSVKSCAHMPERRSPSELLNGRSGRIERIPYEDKVRVRLRDRRSRSLSPQAQRVRTRRGLYHVPTREPNKRGVPSCQDNKSGARQVLSRKRSLSVKKNSQPRNEKEHIVTCKSKLGLMEELFGESSPESEKEVPKYPGPSINTGINQNPHATIKENGDKSLPVAKRSFIPVEKNSSSNSTMATDRNKIVSTENIIYIRRRPRSLIRFEDSESCANNTNVVIRKSSSTSTPLSKAGNNEASSNSSSIISMKPQVNSTLLKEGHDKSLSPPKDMELTEVKKQEPRSSVKRQTDTTPLYFKENTSKNNISDESFQDIDPFCESEDSSSSAASDVTWNPKRSKTRKKPMKRSVRPRR